MLLLQLHRSELWGFSSLKRRKGSETNTSASYNLDASPRTSPRDQPMRMSLRKSFFGSFPKDTNDMMKVLLTQQNTFAAIFWSNWPRMILTSLPCGQKDTYVKVSRRSYPRGLKAMGRKHSRTPGPPRALPEQRRQGNSSPPAQSSPDSLALSGASFLLFLAASPPWS